MEHELPEGWVWTTFSELISLSQNGCGKRNSNEGNFTVMLKLSDINKGAISLADTREIKLTNDEIESYQLLENDLVCIRVNGSRSLVGRMVRFRILSRDPIAYCDHFIRFRPANAELVAFLSLYFETKKARQHIELNMVSSAGQNTVSQGTIMSVDIPVPPLPEQHRIVAAIEQQFSRLDAAVTSLQHARAKLKRQRAAILKAAVEGTLTEVWRTEHPASETAEQLLQRILNERHNKWEAEQLAKIQARGVAPKDDKWKDAYKDPEPPDTTNLPELPEGWMWATVEQGAFLVTDGDHNPPKRVPSGIPHLTARNIVHSQIDFTGCTFVTEEDAKKAFRRYQPLSGDLIVTTVGTIGRTAIVPDGIVFSPDRNLAAIRTVINYPFTMFLEYCLMSPDYQIMMANASGSTAQPHLYLSDLRSLSFPLPPVVEQEQIVSEVEARLSIIAQTELEVEANLKRAERLRQTILAEAFAGRLVPQHPGDEPASVLLERIRRERGGMQKKGKAGNGRAITVPDEPVQIEVEGTQQVELWESVGGG